VNFDERDLYTGLAALHWATISDTDSRWDQPFYRRIIVENGGRALELGCGAGRLLLAYLADGLDVVGVDISGDMLAVCREHAAAAGQQPELYEQPMQELDVPGRFRTIYIPCGSFVVVMDRQEALETLRRCHAHLEPGGTLAFNVFLPDDEYFDATDSASFPRPWQFKAEKDPGGGRRLVVSTRLTGVDPIEQIWMEERRYQLYAGDELVQEEVHAGQGRWYTRNEVLWMLQLAGFTAVAVKGDYTAEDFNPRHESTMVFLARKPDDG
jgi:ubiquinone/menaquinone biosynthesis C-methylase UbiE